MVNIIKTIFKALFPLFLFSFGYIIAMTYELHNGDGFYSQRDDIRYKIKGKQNKMIKNGYMYIDSIEGYFQTVRKSTTDTIAKYHNCIDTIGLSANDACVIGKAILYQLYDVNEIDACEPYTISEDDSTFYICGSLEKLPNHLKGRSYHTCEELEEVSSIVYRPVYRVHIRKKDAKILFIAKDI